MKNLLCKSKYAVLAIFLMALSCQKEECPIIEPPEDNKLVIEVNVNKMYWGESGASGEVNGENKEYGMAEFFIAPNNGLFRIAISKFVWYENSVWATREHFSLGNLKTEDFTNGDTVFIKREDFINMTDPSCSIHHLYLDGDAAAECYEIDDEAETPSWLLITEYNPANRVVVGELHLSLEISDECPPKYDPNAPDYITVRNFHFRAKLRE